MTSRPTIYYLKPLQLGPTSVSELCKELGVTPVTLYRYVDPNGNLRDYGKRVFSA